MPTWQRIALFSEIPAAANPTAVVGGAAINGSATTFMRSDGAPALGPLTRDLAFGGFKGTGIALPTNSTDVASKDYVDNEVQALSAGLHWKASVRAATTVAGTLATSFAAGQVIDGVTLDPDDRILIKDQALGDENGIYNVQPTGAPLRSGDADSSAEVLPGLATFVAEGTVNADTGWLLTTNAPITLGTTALVFTQFTSLGQVTAGAGLTKTGSTLDVIGSSSITVSADSIAVAALGITDAHVATANKDGAAGTVSMRTLGTGAAQAAAGNDARLSDTRRPSATAGGTAFDFGAGFTNPVNFFALVGYSTAGRPTAVAGGFYRDTDTDRPYFATNA